MVAAYSELSFPLIRRASVRPDGGGFGWLAVWGCERHTTQPSGVSYDQVRDIDDSGRRPVARRRGRLRRRSAADGPGGVLGSRVWAESERRRQHAVDAFPEAAGL